MPGLHELCALSIVELTSRRLPHILHSIQIKPTTVKITYIAESLEYYLSVGIPPFQGLLELVILHKYYQ